MRYNKTFKKPNKGLKTNYFRILAMFGVLAVVAAIALLAYDGDNAENTYEPNDQHYYENNEIQDNESSIYYSDYYSNHNETEYSGIMPLIIPDPRDPDWIRLNYAINYMSPVPDYIVIYPANPGVGDHWVGSVFNLVITDPNPYTSDEGRTITTLEIPGAPWDNTHRISVTRKVYLSAAPGADIILRMPGPGCTNTADVYPWLTHVSDLGRHFFVYNDGDFVLGDGGGILTLDGNAYVHSDNRGGILVENNGDLVMHSNSRILNGRAMYGGGVEVRDFSSTFTMHDGIIGSFNPEFGNTAARGGGVFVSNGSDFTMWEGVIVGNTAIFGASDPNGLTGGGGVNVNGIDSIFDFNGGLITENTAYEAGAGIGVSDGAKFNMSAGSIYRNLIDGGYGGSGVYIRNADSEFNMTGGYITHNTTVTTPYDTASIGGVAVIGGATFNVFANNTVTISSNSANNIGGIANVDSIVNIGGPAMVIIERNYALGPANPLGTGFFQRGADSVSVLDGSNIYIRNHDLSQTSYSASGVHVENGVFTMHHGTHIYENVGHHPGFAGGLKITGGEVNMYGGRIHSNWGPSGGGVLVFNAIFNMHEGEIYNNEAAVSEGAMDGTGGGVMVFGSDAIFNFQGGTIGHHFDSSSANHALDGGGIWIGAGGTVNMSGSIDFTQILRNHAANISPSGGGGVFITGADSELNMTGGTIGFNTAYNGGGINMLDEATFYMNGGVIRHNQALAPASGAHGAGGVRVGIGTTFNMHGDSVIRHNITDQDGGGVRVEGVINSPREDRGTFVMHGGTISYNEAGRYAGGVFANGGVFTLLNGNIQRNRAGSYGGGIDSIANTYSEMRGGNVRENLAPRGGGLSVRSGSFRIFGGQIYYNRWQPNFPPTPIYEGGGAYVTGGATVLYLHGGTIGGNTPAHANQAETGGGVWVGNGASFYMTHFNMPGGGVIPGAGAIIGNYAVYALNNITHSGGGGVDVRGNNSVFTMTAGQIANNTSYTVGGGVKVYNGGDFQFSGGEITHNTADGVSPSGSGGGVHVTRNSSFTMSGDANIYGNASTNNSGGGVHTNGGAFTMNGGYIENNTAENHGGGVALWSSGTNSPMHFTMFDGIIRDNFAINDGGGVYVGGAVEFNMSGGYIYYNEATNGGGVWVGGLRLINNNVIHSTFNMTGGVIGGESGLYDTFGAPYTLGNTAVNGGGVWVGDNAFFNLGATVLMMGANANSGLITGNEATGTASNDGGGGVHVEGGAIFRMRDGVIQDNDAYFGGGVFVYGSGTLFDFIGGRVGGVQDASGTPILYNKSTTTTTGRGGGGVEVTGGSTIRMGYQANPGTPAEITLNRAYNSGGGMNFHGSSQGVMHSGIISLNGTENDDIYGNGGGIAINVSSHFTMLNGLIESNVGRIGGGVFVCTSTFDMYGGTISANASTHPGGGVAVYSGESLINSPSHFNMFDGLIINNGYQNHPFSNEPTETPRGGGIAIAKHLGVANMRGGNITNNFAYYDGGGVAVMEGGSFNMSPSREPEISGNVAWQDGGGVWVYGVETRAGANFGTRSSFSINIFAGCLVFNSDENCNPCSCNHSTNLYILENTAYRDGGGVAVMRGGHFQIMHPGFLGVVAHIMENTAHNDGGGVYVSGISDLDFHGQPGNMLPTSQHHPSVFIWHGYGMIEDNFAYENGGGIFIGNYEGNLASMTRGNSYSQPFRITGNTANAYGCLSTDGGGGGVYVSRYGEFFARDLTITNNEAPYGMGGGIFSEEHDYNSPLMRVTPTLLPWETISYGNLDLEDVRFGNNLANRRYIPPVNGDLTHLPHIHFLGTSIPINPLPTRVHPLNNYDINYAVPGVTFQFFKTDQQIYEDPQIAVPLGGARFRVFRTEDQSVGTGTAGLVVIDINDDPNSPWEEVFMPVNESPGSFASQPLSFSMTPGFIYQLVEYQVPTGFQVPMGQWRLRVNYLDASIIDIEPIGGLTIPPFVLNDFSQIYIDWFLGNWADFELPMSGGTGFNNPVVMTSATIGVALITGGGVTMCLLIAKKKRKVSLIRLRSGLDT
ncbi:MAG: hypothetical protein FWC73_06675 [Defluviitaleaceae bacterium]|nr:hypothetical protein [Defluviitaleaceae bacterium]